MADNSGNKCAGLWNIGARLWWAVAWRTFLWVSLPVMVVQFLIAYLKTPEVAMGLIGLTMMLMHEAPTMLRDMAVTPEFWFFIAVSVWSLLGGIYVYGYLVCKKEFGGVRLEASRK